MKAPETMTREELLMEKAALEKQFEEIKARKLKLDMSRGKPSKAQLELSNGMDDASTRSGSMPQFIRLDL